MWFWLGAAAWAALCIRLKSQNGGGGGDARLVWAGREE